MKTQIDISSTGDLVITINKDYAGEAFKFLEKFYADIVHEPTGKPLTLIENFEIIGYCSYNPVIKIKEDTFEVKEWSRVKDAWICYPVRWGENGWFICDDSTYYFDNNGILVCKED